MTLQIGGGGGGGGDANVANPPSFPTSESTPARSLVIMWHGYVIQKFLSGWWGNYCELIIFMTLAALDTIAKKEK